MPCWAVRPEGLSWRGICLAALVAPWLAACATSGGPASAPLRIDGLTFENRSRTAVASIRLIVSADGRFVSCGHIAPGGVCASGFPDVAWEGHPLQVDWVQAGQPWSTGEVTVTPDTAVRNAGVAAVRVVVLAPGSAGVVLVSSDGGAGLNTASGPR